MSDQPVDTLDRGGRAGLQFDGVPDQRRDRVGDDNCARRRETRDPCGEIDRQPVYVVLGGVEVHHPAVHPDPYVYLDTEPALGRGTELCDLAGDLQSRQHRPANIVLVGSGMTEHRQQPVTFDRLDMALKSVNGRQHQLLVAADEKAIRFRFHLGRQHRRIHQVSKQDRQPTDFPTRLRPVGQQVFGVGIADISSQHPSRQRSRRRTITTIDRRNRPIQQLINRVARHWVDVAVSRGAHPAVAHVNMVSPRSPNRCVFTDDPL